MLKLLNILLFLIAILANQQAFADNLDNSLRILIERMQERSFSERSAQSQTERNCGSEGWAIYRFGDSSSWAKCEHRDEDPQGKYNGKCRAFIYNGQVYSYPDKVLTDLSPVDLRGLEFERCVTKEEMVLLTNPSSKNNPSETIIHKDEKQK